MKFFTLAIFIFMDLAAAAQTKNSLVGTWYAKIESHSSDYKKAAIYIKKEISSSYSKLKIDSLLRYRFTEPHPQPSMIGIMAIHGDTLYFIPREGGAPIKAFLYYADSSQLIYSGYRIPEDYQKPQDIRNGNGGFMPVEVEAKYRDGDYSFYKTIYRQLAVDNHQQKDSTAILKFEIQIDDKGKADINSLEAKNEISSPYLSSVKKALSSLKTDFIPCIQNGAAVKSYLNFQFNY